MKNKKEVKKGNSQTIKENQVTEWCDTCTNPAYKCKNGCTGHASDNETSKQYNKK